MFKTRYQQFKPEVVFINVQKEFGAFIMSFALILGVSYSFLMVIDFLPEPPQATPATATYEKEPVEIEQVNQVEEEAPSSVQVPVIAVSQTDSDENGADIAPYKTNKEVLPVEIQIDKLNKRVEILNPESRSVSVLDSALQKGAVRHPDSANLAQEGNMFILGHSSRLPNVFNKNYQAFNDIETLEWGDTIRVFSNDTEYIYRVEKVYEAKASTVVVPIANTGARLTLATCDSFGSKDDRFIVEASLQGTKPL